jgi:hypothetical protein
MMVMRYLSADVIKDCSIDHPGSNKHFHPHKIVDREITSGSSPDGYVIFPPSVFS